MNKRLFLLSMPLLILAVFLIPNVPQAHAVLANGQVCLADPTTVNSASPCPAVPPTFNGPAPTTVTPPQVSRTQLLVGVYTQGSDKVNGFSITLLADHTILTPVDADFTGTVLSQVGAPTVIAKCVGGIAKTGSCDATTDTVDTLHFAVAVLGGATNAPTTGLLFTAIYNITGSATAGGVPVGYQTGCGGSSVADGITCVTVTNGGSVPGQPNVDPETVQAGTFDNSTPPPWVSISSSTSTIGPILGSGVSGTATITTTAQNSWPPPSSGDSISFTTQQTAGLTASLSGGGTCHPAACSITLTVSGAAGNYVVTVLGKYSTIDATTTMTSTLIAPVTLSVVIQDFSISVSSATANIPPNGAAYGALTVTVASLNGFTGTVAVSTSALAPSGLTVSYTPASYTLAAGGSQDSTVTMSSTSMNRYLLTIKAVSGSLTRMSALVRVFVNSFTITASPATLSFNAGDSGPTTHTTLTLQSYPIGSSTTGFVGTVTLTNSTVANFGPKAPCPATATLAAGASATVVCNFSSTVAGTYTMMITGSAGFNGAITNTTSITATVVPVFGLSASPTALNVNATAAGTSTITASDQGGFSGTVTLSYSVSPTSGLTCSLTPPAITVPLGGQGTSTLSCSGSVGVYTVTVTGTATGLTPKTVTVVYTVQDFSVTAGAASPNPVLAGATTTSTITVSPILGFTGTVSLTVSPSTPAGASCALNPPSQKLGGQFTSYLTCSASTAGTYSVTVTGTSQPYTHTTAAVQFTVETFIISASSPTVVNVGASGTSTITLTGSSSSPDTVNLASSASTPSGLTCTLASSVTVPPSATTPLSCSAMAAGDYSVIVTGSVGAESHSTAAILFHVADFTITAGPLTPSVINVGSSGSTTVSLNNINGFTDAVSLSVSITPTTGLTGSCSPQAISGSGTSTCTITATVPGNYTVTITGVDGSLSHYTAMMVQVPAPDFSLSASPTTVTFTAGGNDITTVNMTALHGFSGSVSFGAAVDSPGLDVTCGPQTITGTATSVCHFYGSVVGTYTVTIKGTSADLQHSVVVKVTVNRVQNNGILGLDPTVFFSILGVVVVGVIGGVVVVIRRRAAAGRRAAAARPRRP